MNNKEFDFDKLVALNHIAIDPYLVSIEEALNNPSNQHLNRTQQATLVKQMFNRSLRMVAFNFSTAVDKYVNAITIDEIEQAKKAKAKQEKNSTATTPKKINPNQKKTLKELREERAKKQANKEE